MKGQGSKYKNILACHFIISLGALISYGLPSMNFHLPSVKFGLKFGHWQAAISSPEGAYETRALTTWMSHLPAL
jgi:hypothetical protein